MKEGDCVSIKLIIFGEVFEKQMNDFGFVDGLVYGRVTEMIVDNRDFTVVWDIDSQISKHMTSSTS